MQVELAVSKVKKYATSESGDTVEFVERPRGGLSAVMVDGQRSGRGAKLISNLASRKAISLLGEGVRDEAVARAANDYLFAQRGGMVSATLHILSVLMGQRRVVLARNGQSPFYLFQAGKLHCFDEPSRPLGQRADTAPVMREIEIDGSPLYVVAATDGLHAAGRRRSLSLDVAAEMDAFRSAGESGAERLADRLLEAAISLDEGRPVDDITVLVMSVLPIEADQARRMRVRVPLGPVSR